MAKKEQKRLSPSQRSWRRFKKNRAAVIGAFIIAFSILVAIFGYHLAPDKTTHADNKMASLNQKGPGFNVTILNVTRNYSVERYSGIQQFSKGKSKSSLMDEFPIQNHKFQGDSIIVEGYKSNSKGDLLKGRKKAFHIVDVVFGVSEDNDSIMANRAEKGYSFYGLDGTLQKVSKKEVTDKISNEMLTSRKFRMGTDLHGRDLLSRLILGTRISLSVGLVATVVSLFIGLLLGCLAGYFRGWVDDLIMWLINTIWAIPTILLIFAITITRGNNFYWIYLAVGLTMWVEVARVVRGQVLKERTIEYVEAAQSMAFSNFRIMLRHILPNIMGPLMVITAANFATAILVEAGLSFLGIGVQPPMPSWGLMLKENYAYIVQGNLAYLALIPGFAILIMVLAFNLVGNGLRDALDVKSRI